MPEKCNLEIYNGTDLVANGNYIEEIKGDCIECFRKDKCKELLELLRQGKWKEAVKVL